MEETREICGGIYRVGHTGDYVKVAVESEGTNGEAANIFVKVLVKGFLTDEILLGELCAVES